MKNYLTAALILSSILGTVSVQCNSPHRGHDYWYGQVGAGYAWTTNAGIHNPNPLVWDAAIQGYNDDLGGASFASLEIGRLFGRGFSTGLRYAFYDTFHYQKFQTGTSDTPSFSGNSRHRFFDLDHQHILVHFTFDPLKFIRCRPILCGIKISPSLEVGIGPGFNRVTNFHTVGLLEIPGTGTAVGSTTLIGATHSEVSFAWEAGVGVKFKVECLNLSWRIGYRYYDGGRFQGPSTVYPNSVLNQGLATRATPWKGHLRANEAVFQIDFGF